MSLVKLHFSLHSLILRSCNRMCQTAVPCTEYLPKGRSKRFMFCFSLMFDKCKGNITIFLKINTKVTCYGLCCFASCYFKMYPNVFRVLRLASSTGSKRQSFSVHNRRERKGSMQASGKQAPVCNLIELLQNTISSSTVSCFFCDTRDKHINI